MSKTRPSRPSRKEEFRDLLATADARKVLVNAIRSERQFSTFCPQDIRVFEKIRDELRNTVHSIQSLHAA